MVASLVDDLRKLRKSLVAYVNNEETCESCYRAALDAARALRAVEESLLGHRQFSEVLGLPNPFLAPPEQKVIVPPDWIEGALAQYDDDLKK